jgi:3-hydroxyacyl-CoA dehydrogenase
MSDVVGYRVREGVALITVDNPPINALSHPVRAGLLGALEAALGDPDVGAVVIQAEGRTFPAGADLRDFQARIEAPTLGEVCRAIEDCPKPVLAAIHGTALGGGLELALACHYRLAHVEAQLGLPDVALGAVPTAGASQRLPRIVGAKTALDMLISARPISAEGAMRIGLIDKVIQKNLGRAAFGSARNFVGSGTAPRPTRARREGMRDPKAYLETVEARRAALAEDRRDAAHKAIDLVEAALLLPFEAGLELERVSFEDLVESDQARGLRHIFLAERRTAREPALAPVRARRIERIGVVGTGRLASEIARAALAARLRVTLQADDGAALAAAQARIEAGLAREVERGRLGAAKRDAQLAWLTAATDPEALAACDLVIEALDGDHLDARRALFARLGAVTGPDTVLASATVRDGEALEACALASTRPADVMALRFSRPAHHTRLVEVLRRADAADDLGATAVALAHALGKVPVLPGRPPGIAAPMLAALWHAAGWLVEEGAAPIAVDAALRDYGFAEGPFEMMDRIGLDRLGLADGRAGALVGRMQAQGWTGRAVGRGFRAQGDAAWPDALAPGVAELIDALRRDLGLTPRVVPADEIVARCLGAMVNAGAGLVAHRIAARPSDIDVTMVLGYGFARWRGGPMEAADLGGLLALRTRLRDWGADRDGALWQPQPLFDELIKNGRGFASLNR